MITVHEAVRLMGAHLNMLTLESGMSLPIPMLEERHLLLRRYVYTKRLLAGEGTYMTPPELVACVDMTTGKFVSVQSVPPDAFAGPDDSSGLQAGVQAPKLDPPAFESPEELLATYRRLYDLYDLLLPGFAAGEPAAQASSEEVEGAKEFRQLFQRLREAPLEAFYRQQGSEFFKRIDQLAL